MSGFRCCVQHVKAQEVQRQVSVDGMSYAKVARRVGLVRTPGGGNSLIAPVRSMGGIGRELVVHADSVVFKKVDFLAFMVAVLKTVQEFTSFSKQCKRSKFYKPTCRRPVFKMRTAFLISRDCCAVSLYV